MSLLARQSRGSFTNTITTGLIVLASLVVAAKYIAPILYYVSERLQGRPIADVPVMWDFWWPIYFIVAATISGRSRRSWLLFIALVVGRSLFSIVVLTLFAAQPEWTFWKMQWLFYEVITLMAMVGGLILALVPTAREEMSARYRPISPLNEVKTF